MGSFIRFWSIDVDRAYAEAYSMYANIGARDDKTGNIGAPGATRMLDTRFGNSTLVLL
jgi:hypothetical protein